MNIAIRQFIAMQGDKLAADQRRTMREGEHLLALRYGNNAVTRAEAALRNEKRRLHGGAFAAMAAPRQPAVPNTKSPTAVAGTPVSVASKVSSPADTCASAAAALNLNTAEDSPLSTTNSRIAPTS